MKNKKLLSILAVTMLAGVALTGCNNETGSTSSNSSHEETTNHIRKPLVVKVTVK